jgi:hypothetical protein
MNYTPQASAFNQAARDERHVTQSNYRDKRAALFVAHPAHELRIYGWLENVRPHVFVLTDGSGRGSRSRLASTSGVLAQSGARAGRLYGRFTDREIYEAILARRSAVFTSLADELAEAMAREAVDYVVGDAAEGEYLAHDVCRLLIDSAVELLSGSAGRRVANYEFSPTGHLAPEGDADPARAIRLALDHESFGRKMRAAWSYPEIRAEVEAAVRALGDEGLREEYLRPVASWDSLALTGDAQPYYERHGEKLVAAGHYPQVIRRREHVRPLAEALRDHVARRA